jgi:hypothetical protein
MKEEERERDNKNKKIWKSAGWEGRDNDQPAVGGLGGTKSKGRVFQLRPSAR